MTRQGAAGADLAVVDLGGARSEAVEAMAAACASTGFFRIPRSVIPRAVADDAWDAAREFFALADVEKRSVEFPEPGYPYGYSPFRYETLARSLDDISARPDLKESFSAGPDCGPGLPSGPDDAWIRSPTLWPSRPAGMRDAWTAYYRALASVAEQLMSLMALALELPEDYFSSLIDRPISSLRAIHYPTLDTTSADGSLRAGAHADYGTLTILRTDDVQGLEILTAGGRWAPVAPDPDTFVVNLGDSIAQWTNDRWRSTIHRVTCVTPLERMSMAFFHMANWDAVIECLPTCREAGEPPRHPPAQAGPWLMRKFQSTVA